MIFRVFLFLLCLVAGAAAGRLLVGGSAHWPGAILGAFVWLVLDLLAMARLQRWLAVQQQAPVPGRSDEVRAPRLGAWAEMANRVQRMLRKLDQAQQQSQARLDDFLLAMQASPTGVVLLDAQGRIEWFNQMATQQYGFEVQRDLMQYVANLIRDPAFTRYLSAADFTSDVQVQGRSSTASHPVKLSVRLHPYGEGRRLLLSRDITAVQQAEAMRRDFVANVSHEIRTPLTVLAGFVETLQNLPLAEEERRHYLALMATQASRMQTLVQDLLTLSRLEGSPLPRSQEWLGMAGLLAQCEADAHALSGLLAPMAHALTFSQEGDWEIAGEHTELFSAMSNLVTNALRYTPAPGRVDVTWRTGADGRGEFSVQDNGPGIAPEHLPRLTERFYRVDRSRSRETGGTGLGLAIVKHVAQRHGGELQIQSQPGQGSRFCIVFPPSRVRAAQTAQAPQLENAQA